MPTASPIRMNSPRRLAAPSRFHWQPMCQPEHAMASPLYMTLLAGPVVAVPVPKPLIDALVSVEVTESATGRSGFQLTFTLGNNSILQTLFLLAGSAPIPVLRVILVVSFGGLPQVIMDGIIQHHEVVPDAMSGSSKLVVTGQDLTSLMDLIDFSGL